MKHAIITIAICVVLSSQVNYCIAGDNTNPEFQGVQEFGPFARTGFEDLNGDETDATNFSVGPATFTGGVAGTRSFPPGYFKGDYAFITPGQLGVVSKIDFSQSTFFNLVRFKAKDIRELTPDGKGKLIVTYKFFPFKRRIKLTKKWRPYTFFFVDSINVKSTGVSNIDTFSVLSF